jgi:hypothetical protein
VERQAFLHERKHRLRKDLHAHALLSLNPKP